MRTIIYIAIAVIVLAGILYAREASQAIMEDENNDD